MEQKDVFLVKVRFTYFNPNELFMHQTLSGKVRISMWDSDYRVWAPVEFLPDGEERIAPGETK